MFLPYFYELLSLDQNLFIYLHTIRRTIYKFMKKLLLFFILIIVIAYYGYNYKGKTEVIPQQASDSIILIDKREQEVQDSIEQVRIDSLSLIAWGEVKFGISMKKALSTEIFRNGHTYSDRETDLYRISMEYDKLMKLKKILGLNIPFELLDASFHKDELTDIHIKSYNANPNEIPKLVADCNTLIKNFKEKYKAPSYQRDYIHTSNFESGKEFTYAKFQIGSKSIIIKLGKVSHEDYYYIIYIANNQFPKKKHVQTEKEKQEEAKSMREAEEIKNNSF